jgi:DNA-directed RNA polymerase subunit M/transcription elongation factor TFIIS
MEFCPECESLLYYQEDDSGLVNYCNGCGYKKDSDKVLISQNSYSTGGTSTFGSRKNYIYDSTLPRTAKYVCPNEDCITHKDSDKKEAVFFNEGDSLKNVFICKECQTEWKY